MPLLFDAKNDTIVYYECMYVNGKRELLIFNIIERERIPLDRLKSFEKWELHNFISI